MITTLRHEVPPFRETNVFEVSLHGGASVIYVEQILVPEGQTNSRGLAVGEIVTTPNGKAKFAYYLWAVEDMRAPIEKHRFWFVRDGDDLTPLGEDAALYHVTSFRSIDGRLWCHVFDITHMPDDFAPDKRTRPMPSTFYRRPGSVTRRGAGSTTERE